MSKGGDCKKYYLFLYGITRSNHLCFRKSVKNEYNFPFEFLKNIKCNYRIFVFLLIAYV